MRVRMMGVLAVVAMVTTGCTVSAWGYNPFGGLGDGTTANSSTPVVSDGDGWATVSTGSFHSCGVRSDGTLWCWGRNNFGQLGIGSTTNYPVPVQVGTASDWTSVSVGGNFTCGTRSSATLGTLWCWGRNNFGQLGTGSTVDELVPTQVGTASDWANLSANFGHSCGIRISGAASTMWCWGSGALGALGNGSTMDELVPTQVGTASDWVNVSAGDAHSCGVRSSGTEGTAWCWGRNDLGQLGTGSTSGYSPVPVQVGAESDWVELSAADFHSCGTRGTPGFGGSLGSTLWCWGRNTSGELGDGTTNNSPMPVQVGTSADWANVSTGGVHTCATTLLPGTAWCWGDNSSGQLGDGTNNGSLVPVQVGAASDWVEISVQGRYVCGLNTSTSVSCWGANSVGQLGDGTTTDSAVPVALESGVEWVDPTAGEFHTCKRSSIKILWCYGANGQGQLGLGDTVNRSNPVPLPGTWIAAAAASTSTCAIDESTNLWCWGRNVEGQLGNGTNTSSFSPVLVPGGGGWTQISGGEYHHCGVRSEAAYCWGANENGQLGIGSTTPSTTPAVVFGGLAPNIVSVEAGGNHSCAITTQNQMWCWGLNDEGQLGTNTTVSSTSPVVVGDGWKSVSPSVGKYTCGVKTTGTAWCWGNNFQGRLGTGNTANSIIPAQVGSSTTWVRVETGRNHTCGIDSGPAPNQMLCWGDNTYGQIGDGTTTSRLSPTQVGAGRNWTFVATGHNHTVGIDL